MLRLPGGLVNAHDHLEFALFPRLGEGPYPNARAWADAVYRPDQSPVREHLRIPKRDRLWWGALRNLLSGVTTVHHHNPDEPEVFGDDFPVRVVRNLPWAHSLDFSPDLDETFRRSDPQEPFILHAGEGTDARSAQEIRRLRDAGLIAERTVLVHAVAVEDVAPASVIWCPSSNLFTLGRARTTLPPNSALATDSSLTAQGDLLDELAVAEDVAVTIKPDRRRLLDLVTRSARSVLGLPDPPDDDFTLFRDRGLRIEDVLFDSPRGDLQQVVVRGRLQLTADAAPVPGLEPIWYGDRRYQVRAPVGDLLARAQAVLGPEIRLGHKLVRAG